MSSISQHISLGQIHNERTSIIYVVTDIVFSLKQHIPPSGELLSAEVSLVLHRSLGQSKYAVYLPTRRRMYRSSTCVESWHFCPTAFLLRSGEFIPRHPVHIRFSRCIGSMILVGFLCFEKFGTRFDADLVAVLIDIHMEATTSAVFRFQKIVQSLTFQAGVFGFSVNR